jgi:hypothetical protein
MRERSEGEEKLRLVTNRESLCFRRSVSFPKEKSMTRSRLIHGDQDEAFFCKGAYLKSVTLARR